MQSTRRGTGADSTSSAPMTTSATPRAPAPPAVSPRAGALLDQVREPLALFVVQRLVDAGAHAHERLAQLLEPAIVACVELAEQHLVEVALAEGRRDVGPGPFVLTL